jgi:hypothetical protein
MVAGSDRGDEKAKKPADANDPLGAIHDFTGQAINSALGAVTGFDAKTLVAKLPPESIASYMRGKDIDPQSPVLNTQQKADLKIYTALRESLTANIPFYDHSAFVKSMEQEIGERSRETDNSEQRKAEGDRTSNAPAETKPTITKEAGNNQPSAVEANPNASTKTLQPNRAGLQSATTDEKIPNGAAKFDIGGSGNKLSTTDSGIDAARSIKSDFSGHPGKSSKPDISQDPERSSKSYINHDLGNSSKSAISHDSGNSAKYAISRDSGNSSKPDLSHDPGKPSKPDLSHDPGKPSNLDVIHDLGKPSKLDFIHDPDKSSRPDASSESQKASKSLISGDPGKSSKSELSGVPEKSSRLDTSGDPGNRTRSDISGHPDSQPEQLNHSARAIRSNIEESGKGKNNDTTSSGAALNPSSLSAIKEQLVQSKQNDLEKLTENRETAHHQNSTPLLTDSSGGSSTKSDGSRETKSRSEDRGEISQDKTQRAEFGSKRSEPITWDNVVHNQKQNDATASIHAIIPGENRSSPKESSSSKSNDTINSLARAIHQVDQNPISKSDSKIAAAAIRPDGDKSILTTASKENVEKFNQLLNSHGIARIRWQNSLNQTHLETAKSVSNRQTNTVIPSSVQTNIRDTKGDGKGDANHPQDPHGISRANADLRQAFASGNFALSPKTADTASFTVTAQTFSPNDKRYILGSEIALAVIIAAAGATRIRAEGQKTGLHPELIPGEKRPEIGDQTVSPDEVGVELHVATGEDEAAVQEASEEREDIVQDTPEGRGEIMQETTEEHASKTKLNDTFDTDLGDSVASDSPAPPSVRPKQNRTPSIRPKTLVASTDTLVSIAEAFFYDRNVAWLIADLNQSIVKETWMDGKRIIEIKSRQQIELPLWTDIEIFYKNKPSHARPEDLITIVQQTAIDAELLNDSLRKLLDQNNS